LGDVVGSTGIRDREGFRERIERACTAANRAYSEDAYAGFKVLKGLDEIGGVLSGLRHAYRVIDTIAEHLRPNAIRFVVVWGQIDTAAETRDVARMDGPAFHLGAEMMLELKQSGLRFALRSDHELLDAAISGEINLLLMLKESWTAKQHEVIEAYRNTGSQSEAARLLGVTQQAVSKTLSRSLWREIMAIEGRLNAGLAAYPKAVS